MFDPVLVQAIAEKFDVEVNRVTRIEEWHRVLFVVIAGKGGRFVSKKLKNIKMQESSINLEQLKESSKEKALQDINNYIFSMLSKGETKSENQRERFGYFYHEYLSYSLQKERSDEWWKDNSVNNIVPLERFFVRDDKDIEKWLSLVNKYVLIY